ncbi:MAG: hypothetical protein WAU89_04580, partial [Candidatus Acidiferrales bacterium]
LQLLDLRKHLSDHASSLQLWWIGTSRSILGRVLYIVSLLTPVLFFELLLRETPDMRGKFIQLGLACASGIISYFCYLSTRQISQATAKVPRQREA